MPDRVDSAQKATQIQVSGGCSPSLDT